MICLSKTAPLRSRLGLTLLKVSGDLTNCVFERLGFGGVESLRRPALMLFILAMLGFVAAAIYALPRT